MSTRNQKIQITELDFLQIKENLKSYLSSQDQFKDYDFEGSTINILLDLLAYNTHYSAFYANMVANEMFLDSASTRGAISSHAKHLNYTPRSRRSASMVVNTRTTLDSDVIIPRGSSFRGIVEDGTSLNFITTDSYVIKANETVSMTLYQGSLSKSSFVYNSNHTASTFFVIPDKDVDVSSLKVTLQTSMTDNSGYGDVWENADNITNATADSKLFYVEETPRGNYRIIFGDGILSKKPDNGNVISVEYVATKGEGGNNVGKRSTDVIVSDSVGDLLLEIEEESSGGQNKESDQSVKFNAPRYYQSGNRAVTADDFKTIVTKYYSDSKSVFVYGGEEASPPQYGKVFICIKPNNADKLSESQKKSLKNVILKDKGVVTVIPEIVDPDLIYLNFDIKAYFDSYKTNLSSDSMKSLISVNISTYLNNVLNFFDKNFYISNLSKTIDNTDTSISGSDISISIEKRFTISPIFMTPVYLDFKNEIHHPHDGHEIPSVSSSSFLYKDQNLVTQECFIEDDGYGKLRVFYVSNEEKIIISHDVGSVDYTKGEIVITNDFTPVKDISSNSVRIICKPSNRVVLSKNNSILTFDPFVDSLNLSIDDISKQSSKIN